MRAKKATMTSRRGFLSNALGLSLVSASTWPIRTDQARSIHGQSDGSTAHSGRTTQNRSLTWEVFLAPSIPAIAPDVPPGETERPWPPISSTLISGERDAVLVDTPITVDQARALANWVVASGKNLTTIYATHGHGDHFFGTSTVLKRFPGARFVARPEVIGIMRQQASPESLETFWNPRFPDQISSQLVRWLEGDERIQRHESVEPEDSVLDRRENGLERRMDAGGAKRVAVAAGGHNDHRSLAPLAEPVLVHSRSPKDPRIRKRSVYPALQDRRHGKPPQREAEHEQVA